MAKCPTATTDIFSTTRSTVLAEYNVPSVSGNFAMVTRKILEKIPPQNGKMSYSYDRHIFHYSVDNGLTYLCMADEAFGRRVPFAFLEDIRNRFLATYGNRWQTAPALGMNEDFGRVLQVQMEYFSNNPNADKVNKVKGQLDEITGIMMQNIEKVLERGERIELLVDKTEQLNSTAMNFKKQSTNLKRALWWKNVKLMIVIVAILIVVALVIVTIACGGFTWSRCISHGSSHGSTTTTSSTHATTTTHAAATTSPAQAPRALAAVGGYGFAP